VKTGDDWQKSQWLPPRLAQGTRVIRQVSCGRRRVGEVGEDRSRLTVEQNVFSRALGATPFKRSSASQAVRHHILTAQDAYIPLSNAVSNSDRL
jgi:hypothetical protein